MFFLFRGSRGLTPPPLSDPTAKKALIFGVSSLLDGLLSESQSCALNQNSEEPQGRWKHKTIQLDFNSESQDMNLKGKKQKVQKSPIIQVHL